VCLEVFFFLNKQKWKRKHAVKMMVAGPPQGLTDRPCKPLWWCFYPKGKGAERSEKRRTKFVR